MTKGMQSVSGPDRFGFPSIFKLTLLLFLACPLLGCGSSIDEEELRAEVKVLLAAGLEEKGLSDLSVDGVSIEQDAEKHYTGTAQLGNKHGDSFQAELDVTMTEKGKFHLNWTIPLEQMMLRKAREFLRGQLDGRGLTQVKIRSITLDDESGEGRLYEGYAELFDDEGETGRAALTVSVTDGENINLEWKIVPKAD